MEKVTTSSAPSPFTSPVVKEVALSHVATEFDIVIPPLEAQSAHWKLVAYVELVDDKNIGSGKPSPSISDSVTA